MSGLCWGIVVIWVCGLVWLVYKFKTAPCGVEIPGIGFVEVDDERTDED